MATQQIKASAAGVYPIPIALTTFGPAGVGVLVTVPNGVTASYTVQVSGDPPGVAPVNLNPHDTLGTSQTASANGNLQYPCTFVVLNLLSVTGGSVTMSVVQADCSRQ